MTAATLPILSAKNQPEAIGRSEPATTKFGLTEQRSFNEKLSSAIGDGTAAHIHRGHSTNDKKTAVFDPNGCESSLLPSLGADLLSQLIALRHKESVVKAELPIQSEPSIRQNDSCRTPLQDLSIRKDAFGKVAQVKDKVFFSISKENQDLKPPITDHLDAKARNASQTALIDYSSLVQQCSLVKSQNLHVAEFHRQDESPKGEPQNGNSDHFKATTTFSKNGNVSTAEISVRGSEPILAKISHSGDSVSISIRTLDVGTAERASSSLPDLATALNDNGVAFDKIEVLIAQQTTIGTSFAKFKEIGQKTIGKRKGK